MLHRKPAQGRLSRAERRELDRLIRRNGVTIANGDGDYRRNSGGTVAQIDGAEAVETGWFWIDLTAAGTSGPDLGKYAWRTVVPDPLSPTGFTVSGPTGSIATDPAIEANGFADLPAHTYVEVRRDRRTRRIVFQLENCVS